uniref:C2 domain-containing protein n=1 Tax=Chromera velia CCMP2878 TaxID=1169474 RepID=A0A0G4GQ74_9ALVE|eukprot:Cvel_22843.t1-p1 / transcript=Cvel_22843.t1 / gene=Cvel_22843 / organism=Chromera_velia_CCMP2878 / gene_product=Tellurium resistance protein TerZ, putative / transcript_product=Tellurium resistance protein TerZ, putative / location=Cvel_scaffold2289:14014-19681(+) / protein_length=705 / sequence_SO=supercontig / SO=protein_coding / is_pseudo=false
MSDLPPAYDAFQSPQATPSYQNNGGAPSSGGGTPNNPDNTPAPPRYNPPPPLAPDYPQTQQTPQPQVIVVMGAGDQGAAPPAPNPVAPQPVAPAPAPPEVDPFARMEHLDIPYSMKEDLLACSHTDILVIADDSGSMRELVSDRATPTLTRWQELQMTLGTLVELLLAVDHLDGFHLKFLNRHDFIPIRTAQDLDDAFAKRGLPGGGTPLANNLQIAFTGSWNPKRPDGEAIVLIATDGEPSDCSFRDMASLLTHRPRHFYCSFLMCTNEDDVVEQFNKTIDPIHGCDISDDYQSEKAERRKLHGKDLTKREWLAKCVLGGKFPKYDRMDDPAGMSLTHHGGGHRKTSTAQAVEPYAWRPVTKHQHQPLINPHGHHTPIDTRKDGASPEWNSAEILVVGARDLKAADIRLFAKNTSDPYVLLAHQKGLMGGPPIKTGYRRKDLNPTWNETLYAKFGYQLTKFKFKVFDYDKKSKDDPLGKVEIPLKLFEQAGPMNAGDTRTIEGTFPIKKGQGMLTLKIACTFTVPLSIPGQWTKICSDQFAIGLAWDFSKKKSSVDLDASMVCVSDDFQQQAVVSYTNLNAFGGAIHHSGDDRTGEGSGDDETIRVQTNSLPQNVSRLLVTVNSYQGTPLSELKNAYVRLVVGGGTAMYFNMHKNMPHDTGVLVGVVARRADGWYFQSVMSPVGGRTVAQSLPACVKMCQHLGL